MRLKSHVPVLALTLALCLAGCEAAKDPGVCLTTVDLKNTGVSKDYARTLCMDWVQLLLSNCVQVEQLALNPTTADLAFYCGDRISDWRGELGFEIKHTCNFVDNPSYECKQYAAATHALSLSTSEEQTRIRELILGSDRLTESAMQAEFYIEGDVVPVSSYLR